MDDRVYHASPLFILDYLQTLLKGWSDVFGVQDWAYAGQTEALSQGGEVGEWGIDVYSDANCFHRPLPVTGNGCL
ncbi:uncharacterized protein METZ01_LOCUS408764, partial [marine metagenome]